MLTVIVQWSIHLGLSLTLQDRMGCNEGDAIVSSIADFEVLGVLVCLLSFKMFSFFSINIKTLTPLTSFSRLPHFSL